MCPLDPWRIVFVDLALAEVRSAAIAQEITMPAEYDRLQIPADADIGETLNAKAAEGWIVKQAFSPTDYLLERGGNQQMPARDPGKTPTGPGR